MPNARRAVMFIIPPLVISDYGLLGAMKRVGVKFVLGVYLDR